MVSGQGDSRGSDRSALGAELLALASDRLGNREQARAVVEHALEALRRRGHAGERIGNPKAFLFQTVRTLTAERPSPESWPRPPQVALPRLRGGEARAGQAGSLTGRGDGARDGGSLSAFGVESDPDRRLRAYARCIGRLNRRDRKLLLLRRLHGLKTLQAAERSGLPAAMVEDRLAAALRRCWRQVRPPEHGKLAQKDPVLLAIAWYARLEGGALEHVVDQALEDQALDVSGGVQTRHARVIQLLNL